MATSDQVKQAYRAINRTDISDAQAQAFAAAIDGGATTLDAFIANQIAATTGKQVQAEVATFSFLTGLTPTSTQLDSLATFAKVQADSYASKGQNGTVAPFEALGFDIATNAATSAAFASKYGALSDQDFISSIYIQVTGGSAPSFAGPVPTAGQVAQSPGQALQAQLNYFTALYTANGIANPALAARGAVAGQIISLPYTDANVAASSTLDNQTVNFLTQAAGGNTAVYSAPLSSAPVAGTTFNLTVGTDALVGTGNNDVFNALVDLQTPANSTLTAADTINGGAGTSDTLVITAQGTTAIPNALNGATVSNVEVVSLRAVSTAGVTLDANNVKGLTAFNNNLSTDAVTVQNLAAGAVVTVIGNGTAANGATTAGYVAGATAGTVVFSGGTVGTPTVAINGAGLTSLSIQSNGAANSVGAITSNGQEANVTIVAATNLTATSLSVGTLGTAQTLTVQGAAAKVSLGTLDSDFTTVNASGLTAGGLTATLSATSTAKVTGGAGQDVITTGVVLTTGSVDAGGGTNDILVIANNTALATATLGAKYTNFETLRNVSGSVQDASVVAGITGVEVGATNSGFTKLSVAQAANVTLVGTGISSFATTLTLATDTANDVINLSSKNIGTTPSNQFYIDTQLNIAGVETLNYTTGVGGQLAGGLYDILSFQGGGANKLTAINLAGTSAISLDLTNTANAVTVTDSGIGGELRVSGVAIKGSIIGGTGLNDQFNTNAVVGTTGDFVTYNSGAGNDAISSTFDAINNTSAAAGSLKIDAGAGVDTLTITGGTITAVDNNFQYLNNIEKIVVNSHASATSITTGGFFDNNFKAGGLELTDTISNNSAATFDLGTFSGVAKIMETTSASTSNTSVITGSGADVVTVSALADTSGAISITTGDGADTIALTVTGATLTTGQITINGGAGQDAITVTGSVVGNLVSYVVADGQSTVAAADSITGFVRDTGAAVGHVLDFTGTPTVAANTAGATSVTGYSSGELTYQITAGLVTFAGTSAAGLTLAQETAAVQSIVTTAGATAAFNFGADTYVFHDQAANDSLVKLVGVAAAGVETAGNTANYIHIA